MEVIKELIVKRLINSSSKEALPSENEVNIEIPLEKLTHFIEVGFLMD